MNILVIAHHFLVCSGRYYADAFKRAGHSVRSIGVYRGNKIWGMSLNPELIWQPEPPEDDWQPDLICYIDSDPALLDVVFEGAPRIVIGVDNHVRTYRRSHFAHYFLAHRNVSMMEWDRTISVTLARTASIPPHDMTHLPCAYDPTVHTPSPIPYAERAYDVVCLGMMYPHRMQAVQELIAAGFKVKWGVGYVGESYAAAHHNARIALNLSFNGDLGQRVFETAAMGNVVLTDKCKDFELLDIGESGFYICSQYDVVETARMILDHPERAQHNAKQSQAWAKVHTWDARVKVIERWFEANVPYEDRAKARAGA